MHQVVSVLLPSRQEGFCRLTYGVMQALKRHGVRETAQDPC